MYIAEIPNRSSPPTVLLRESYREEGKVKKRTLANLSALPEEQIEVLRRSLKDQTLISADEGFEITRSRPHGHVATVLGIQEAGLGAGPLDSPAQEAGPGRGDDRGPGAGTPIEAGHGPGAGPGNAFLEPRRGSGCLFSGCP